MQDDFTPVEAGMTGAQLIEVLNGNSAYTKQLIEALAADILLRIIGNNIKQLKVEDNKLYYTLDNENWSTVDNNVWGTITGNINDQTDLKNALDSRATNEQLTGVSNTVTSLSNRVDGISTTVAANTQNIQSNTTAIGNLQTKTANQVSSPMIVAIRISNGFLQYSLDNVTWINVQSIAEINWGAIGGEISNQVDLQQALSSKANVSQLNAHTSNTDNPHDVTKSQVGLGNVDNTSDLDKPISTAMQEVLSGIAEDITDLDNSKLGKSEEIQEIVYMTLEEYNTAKQQEELSNTTIYIVE